MTRFLRQGVADNGRSSSAPPSCGRSQQRPSSGSPPHSLFTVGVLGASIALLALCAGILRRHASRGVDSVREAAAMRHEKMTEDEK